MELQFARYAPHVWKSLTALPRSGWVVRGILNPETVAEHTLSLMVLANELVPPLKDFSVKDNAELFAMLEVHDWPKSDPSIGDEITRHGVDSSDKLKRKFLREKAAMEQICIPLGSTGNRIISLWYRFEESRDAVAEFARALDKYQAIEQALRYARQDPRLLGLGAEFIMGSPPITDPVIYARFIRELVVPHENQ